MFVICAVLSRFFETVTIFKNKKSIKFSSTYQCKYWFAYKLVTRDYIVKVAQILVLLFSDLLSKVVSLIYRTWLFYTLLPLAR